MVLSSGVSTRAATTTCCAIVELRQYTLKQGAFRAFVDLFERNFVESQEQTGATILGTFRVLDDANRFVWVRGFASMEARKDALTAFYGGPVWKEHRSEANAMIVDNDNVLLFHPVNQDAGFSVDLARRAPVGARGERKGLLVATIYDLKTLDVQTFADAFERSIRPALREAGAHVVAALATEHSENTFPGLPVRGDANAFVWFSCFQDEPAYNRYRTALASSSTWATIREQFALWHLYAPPEILRLVPTPRSALSC